MSRLPKETVEKIYELYLEKGMIQDEIAVYLGIDRGAVIHHLQKYPDRARIAVKTAENLRKRSTKSNSTRYTHLRAQIITTFKNTNLTITEISSKLGTTAGTVRKTILRSGGYSEEALHKELARRVKALRKANSIQADVIDNGRYNCAKVPANFTASYKKGYMGEHARVVCECLGLTEIPKGYVVHHVNNDSKDNRFENLVLMTRSEHTSLHRRYYAKGVTTISKESTLKWVEARRQGVAQSTLDDIVYSEQECSAAV